MAKDHSDFINGLKNIPSCPDHPKPKYSGCTCMVLKYLRKIENNKEKN